MNQIRLDSLPPSRGSTFFLRIYFPDTTQIFEKLCHVVYYSLCHQLPVFAFCKNIWASFRNTKAEFCSLGSELCMWLRRRVRTMAVLLCSLSVVGCLFWLFLVLLRVNIRFFLCLFMFCHFVCWRWSGRITWDWGFSLKHCKWYFYHINLQSAMQLCWFLSE